jgi:hypothetical protein
MTRWRRIAVPLAVTFVVGYLTVMVMSGEQPRQRQFVEFEAKGVLKTPPEQVRRIELVQADQHLSLLRQGEDSWATPGGAGIDGASTNSRARRGGPSASLSRTLICARRTDRRTISVQCARICAPAMRRSEASVVRSTAASARNDGRLSNCPRRARRSRQRLEWVDSGHSRKALERIANHPVRRVH